MDRAEKLALLDSSLMRAAEQIGDITEPTMARFYAQYPESLAMFETLGLGDRKSLEGLMVENTLDCLMSWFTQRAEIESMLSQSVPHHQQVLHIPPSYYAGMIEAAIDVVTETIPPQETAERAVWDEIRSGLAEVIADTHRQMQRQ